MRALVLAGMMLATTMAWVPPGTEAVTTPPPGCAGAVQRTYNVTSVAAPVTYNNWGDFDPYGRVYVLSEHADDLLTDVIAGIGNALLDTGQPAMNRTKAHLQRVLDALNTTNLTEAGRLALKWAGELSTDLFETASEVADGTALGAMKPSSFAAPLVVRAHPGDCVTFVLTNILPEPASIHVHGVATPPGQGSALGANPPDLTLPGTQGNYTVHVPDLPGMEGAHFLHSEADARFHTRHGLFGALVVEPAGSVWKAPNGTLTNNSQEAIIERPGASDFREFVLLYHDELQLLNRSLGPLPTVSKYGEYGPGTKGINLRTEPFMDRFLKHDNLSEQGVVVRGHDKSQAYSSYTYGDPGVFVPKAYLGDPTKLRVVNAGPGQHHVHHLHGGGTRWRTTPLAGDTQFDDGRMKADNPILRSPSERTDVVNLGPGESASTEIEGGAGGTQQAAGDFLYHCHIVEHYVAGMWSFWRVFDTRQTGLAELPDRANLTPVAVNSTSLLGNDLPNGTILDATNVRPWVESQLPPRGEPADDEANVWNWSLEERPQGPLYLGEPETTIDWPNYQTTLDGTRPEVLFNPDNGRLAWPLLKPHFGQRPPFAPGHGPAPWLGTKVDGNHPDGLCPAAAPTRDFNIVALATNVSYNPHGDFDVDGQVYTLAKDKAAVEADSGKAEPLALRANQGDCVRILFSSQLKDIPLNKNHSKVNLHTHLVQFDPQASDGVITGFAYEQSLHPANDTATNLTSTALVGNWTINVTSVARLNVNSSIGVGLTEDDLEVVVVDRIVGTEVFLKAPLVRTHGAGRLVGNEFVQLAWFADVELGVVYWHDHVDGLLSWRHGLFGSLTVEPGGSQWCKPLRPAANRTSCPDHKAETGSVADIITSDSSAAFREFVVHIQDRGCLGEASCDANKAGNDDPDPPSRTKEPASLNLDSEPLHRRNRTYPLASWAGIPAGSTIGAVDAPQGDPSTDVLRTYPGDAVVVRTVFAGQSSSAGVGTFTLTGHRFPVEQHLNGSRVVDALSLGISSMHNFRPECGAGGCRKLAGDYLYGMTQAGLLDRGAWGVLRVHDALNESALLALPNNLQPDFTGAMPEPGQPNVTTRYYDVVAMKTNLTYNQNSLLFGAVHMFGLAGEEAGINNGTIRPMPLVLRALPGELVQVNLTNNISGHRASLHASLLDADPDAGLGIPVGVNPDDTVAHTAIRSYRFHAPKELGVAHLRSYGTLLDSQGGAPDATVQALFGALVVEPAGSTFTKATGMTTNLTLAGGAFAREQVLLYASQDPQFQTSTMPYNSFVANVTSVNYRSEPLHQRVGGIRGPIGSEVGMGVDTCDIQPADCGDDFGVRIDIRNPLASLAFTTIPPETPVLEAVLNETLVMRVVGGAGDQLQVHSLDGAWWALDPGMGDCARNHTACNSTLVSAVGIGPAESLNAWVPKAGAGGQGDYLYGSHREAFREDGAWGIVRVCPPAGEPPGTACLAGPLALLLWQAILNATGPFMRVIGDMISDPNLCLDDNVVPCMANHAQSLLACVALLGAQDAAGVTIPPLASLATDTFIYSGFFPRCVKLNNNGVVTWTHSGFPAPAPPEKHTVGTIADGGAGVNRCYDRQDFLPGQTFKVKLRYTPVPLPGNPKVESSIDDGVTWKDCDAAADFSVPGQALIRYRCDIHTVGFMGIGDMKGEVVVLPA